MISIFRQFSTPDVYYRDPSALAVVCCYWRRFLGSRPGRNPLLLQQRFAQLCWPGSVNRVGPVRSPEPVREMPPPGL